MADRDALLNDMWWATGHHGTAEECNAIALRHIAAARLQALRDAGEAVIACPDRTPVVDCYHAIRALMEPPA